MRAEFLNVLAAAASAVAASAALFVAWLSLRESRRASAVAQRQSAHAMDLTLQSRLDPMYPGLRKVLGHLDDGVPQEIRNVLIPFFVLYSDAFAAHREKLLNENDWRGLSSELAYWAQRPTARQAWGAFRNQTWTDGFTEHVDAALAGPAAYPALMTNGVGPSWEWPAEGPRTSS